ncbi:MAG: tetratricopeptide repeat protein [Chloroflexi bacterium]|nr:tetratricopeptide repeat protein [Chloroflexota bacterium]
MAEPPNVDSAVSDTPGAAGETFGSDDGAQAPLRPTRPAGWWHIAGLIGATIGGAVVLVAIGLAGATAGVTLALPLIIGALIGTAAGCAVPATARRRLRLLACLPLVAALVVWPIWSDQGWGSLAWPNQVLAALMAALLALLTAGAVSTIDALGRRGTARAATVTTILLAIPAILVFLVGPLALVQVVRNTEPALNLLGGAITVSHISDEETAEDWFDQAEATARATRGDDSPIVARVLAARADWYESLDDTEAATPLYEEAVQILQQRPAHDPELLGRLLYNLAITARDEGDVSRATGLAAQATYALGEANYPRMARTPWTPGESAFVGRRPSDRVRHHLAAALNLAGSLYYDTGRAFEAADDLLEAIFHYTDLGGEAAGLGPVMAGALNNLGNAYVDLDRNDDARAAYQRSLDLRRRLLPPGHPETARTLHNLGILDAGQARYAQAEAYLREALQIRQRAYGATSLQVAETQVALARMLRAAGQAAAAEPLARTAIASFDQNLRQTGMPETNHGAALLLLADIETEAGRHAEAQASYERAIQLTERRFGSKSPTVHRYLATYAVYLRQRGLTERQAQIEQRLRDLTKLSGDGP